MNNSVDRASTSVTVKPRFSGKRVKVPLGSLGKVVTGNTPSKKDEKYWATEDVPFIKPGDIDESAVTYLADGTEYIADCAIGKARCVGAGAVLVTCIGTIAKIAVVNCNCIAFNQQINAIDVDRNVVDPQYLAYALKANNTRLKMLANAPVVPIINKRQFESFVLLIHSDLNVQREIVSQFTAIGSQRQKLDEELCYLDDLVKSRFIEMFGDPEANNKGYPLVNLSDIAKYYGGLTYKPEQVSDEGTIVLRSCNIQDGHIQLDDVVRVSGLIKERYLVEPNDILMCSRNGSARLVGKAALINEGCEAMSFGAFMMIIRSAYNPYLLSFFSMPAFRTQISTGTATINQITARMLNGVKLPLPPEDSVRKYESYVRKVDKLKESGVSCVAITLGARGSMVFCGNETIESVPPKTRAIDTTCAGDTYIGAMVAGYARGLSLADSVALATKASAMATTKVGAQQSIPTLAEVE